MMNQMGMIPIEDERVEVASVQPIRFWIKYKPDPESPAGLKAEEWVEWAKKGVSIPTTGVDAIKRVMKDRSLWSAIEPFYQNWKKGGDAEIVNGTPLSVWPGVTIDVVEALRAFRVLSVEDLASLSDNVMQKIPNPSMPMLRERARKFLSTKDIAQAVTELTSTKAELDEIRAQLAALQKASAHAAMDADENAAQMAGLDPRVKLRRGRQSVAAE